MYKLSNLAVDDFRSIYTYTLNHFGLHQADKYTEHLEQVFLLLFHTPQIGRLCPDIAKDLRVYHHSKHAIYYRQRTNDIFIVRILHQQMALQLKLFEQDK